MPGGTPNPVGYGYQVRDDSPQDAPLETPSRVTAPPRLEARTTADAVTRALGAIAPDGSIVGPVTLGAGSVGSTELADGSVLAQKIADAAITTAKFALTIRPVEIVGALPAPGTVGRVVFLTTDSQLYRDDGTAWTAAVAATDIVGQITATQIADGSISTPKLAAGAITTAKLAAGSVTANELAANSVIAGKVAAAAISTAELAAGAVNTAKLAAGAVTANELAANSVDATKITVANLSAISANVGTLTAGLIQNAAATRGLRLGTAALPAAWTSYIDLDPASGTDYIARLATDRLLLTRDGTMTLRGNVTVESSGALSVQGALTVDGFANLRGGAQFAIAGAGVNQTGKRRVSADSTGSLVVRVLSDGATEGVKAVVGSYAVAPSPTAKSSSAWAPTSSSVNTTAAGMWVAAGAAVSITLAAADLPAYDGNAKVSGTVRAWISSGGVTSTTVEAQIRARVNGVDVGIVGSVNAVGVSGGPDADISSTFQGTIPIGTGTAVTITLTPEVFLTSATGAPTANASVSEVAAPNTVDWKKSGGTTQQRRGLFLGAEASQPQITLEPVATAPAAANLTEGELWYDGTTHTIKFYDGTSIKTVTAT